MSDYEILSEPVVCEKHGPYSGRITCPACITELKANGVTF